MRVNIDKQFFTGLVAQGINPWVAQRIAKRGLPPRTKRVAFSLPTISELTKNIPPDALFDQYRKILKSLSQRPMKTRRELKDYQLFRDIDRDDSRK